MVMKKKITRNNLIELPLRPYPGMVFVTKNRKAFERAAMELFGREEDLRGKAGRFLMEPSWYHPHTALVWYSSPAVLAHELAHVIFGIFDTVGIRAESGNEEPFCYMLSQLFMEATEKTH
jgi:hypothetical protein